MTLPAVRKSSPRKRSLIEIWLAGRSPQTLRAYAGDLESFGSFVGVPAAEAAERLITLASGEAHELVLAFRVHLEELELAPATIARRLAALRSLVKLAKQLGWCTWSLEIEAPRVETYLDTRGPGAGGVKRILAAIEKLEPQPLRARNRAIVRLLHDLALRRSEVVSLDLAHVAPSIDSIEVLGKGRRSRQRLTLPTPTRRALAAWIAIRGDRPGPLFTRLDQAAAAPTRLTGDSVYKLCGRLGVEAGLDRRLRPHGLRHTAITSALDATRGDVRTVQRFSRHVKLETLLKYDDARKDDASAVADLIAE